MRKRTIKKNFYLNEEENNLLQEKSVKAQKSEATFLRDLIKGCTLKEKPDKEFYESIKILRGIGINLNQIARKANSLNYIDAPEYRKVAEKLNKFILEIKNKYLVDKKD